MAKTDCNNCEWKHEYDTDLAAGSAAMEHSVDEGHDVCLSYNDGRTQTIEP